MNCILHGHLTVTNVHGIYIIIFSKGGGKKALVSKNSHSLNYNPKDGDHEGSGEWEKCFGQDSSSLLRSVQASVNRKYEKTKNPGKYISN